MPDGSIPTYFRKGKVSAGSIPNYSSSNEPHSSNVLPYTIIVWLIVKETGLFPYKDPVIKFEIIYGSRIGMHNAIISFVININYYCLPFIPRPTVVIEAL